MKAIVFKAIKSPALNRFAGEAGLVMALRIFAAVMSYLGVVLLARWLSLSDFGNYGAIMSAVGIGAVAVQFGSTLTIIRFLGEYEVQEQHGKSHGVIRYAERGVLLISLLVMFAIGGAFAFSAWRGTFPSGYMWLAGVLLLPAFALTDVQSAIMRSFCQILPALLPKDVLWRACLPLIGFALFLLVPEEDRLPLLLVLSAVMLTLFALWQHRYLRRSLPGAIREAFPVYDPRTWWATSLPIWLMLISRMSFRTLDVIFVGLLLSPSAAGIYFAASRTSELLGFVLSSLNLVVGPNISKLYAADKKEELTQYLAVASIVIFVPALALFLACALFPNTILSIFGGEFVNGKRVLIIMAFGQLFNAATGSVGVMLNMTGHEKINAKIMITTAPFTALATFIMASFFGTTGAALAASGGIVVWNTLLWRAARKHTEYDPSVWGAFTFILGARKS
jgi:O-antigen/teichoic acid export membrane protein